MSGAPYRLDATYVKVGKEWKYLYRAVDSAGNTIEFMLSAKPPCCPQEVEGDAVLPLLPHGRADTGRY